MYYLEIRFNTKNQIVVKSFMNNYQNDIEIIRDKIVSIKYIEDRRKNLQ